MFSASLTSMMFHSFLPDVGPESGGVARETRDYKTTFDLADLLSSWTDASITQEWPSLPVVGRTAVPVELTQWFGSHVRADSLPSATFFWGRIPINLLVQFYREFREIGPERQYVDLGTTIQASGSGSSFDHDCSAYLARTAAGPAQAKIGAAIIDLGKASIGSPEDYKKRLRHAVTGNIDLSEHAERVLWVLLKRLDQKGLLNDTTISCALVRPPSGMLAGGKGCFDQANAVEMLDAVKDLELQLTKDNLPAAVNMSLGTHVGPHNGDSPLEEYIAATVIRRQKRFLVAAAGNEGGSGVAARREIRANETEFLTLRTGPRCRYLLVEFWWDDAAGTSLTIEANIYEPLATGGRAHHGFVRIDPGLVGATLTLAPAGLPANIVSQSLFHARCRNSLSCIAFAITTAQPMLPMLEVKFGLRSVVDVIVNAWIVVCEDPPLTGFVEGGPEGTIMVPASESGVLSVAGVESSGQPWEGSSRGPAATYDSGKAASRGPLMAHLAELGKLGEVGTSYASPRACADALVAMSDPKKLAQCMDALDVVCQAYGLSRGGLPPWNARTGFHKIRA